MSEACTRLHHQLFALPRFRYPVDPALVPPSGIYVLFEKGEASHGTDRIVRIGTHRGGNNLAQRINEHFLKENKDRSIFRKNIGRAVLNRDSDPFLGQWELDLISRSAREAHRGLIDFEKQRAVETSITQYMRDSFEFVIIPCIEERLVWEAALIAIVSACSECRPSETWLGNHSPIAKIRESGLWLIQGLNKPLPSEWKEDQFRTALQ